MKILLSFETHNSLRSTSLQMTGQAITVQTSDMGNVEVKLTQNTSAMNDTQYIEVVGKVDDQGESLREFTCVMLGDNLSESFHLTV